MSISLEWHHPADSYWRQTGGRFGGYYHIDVISFIVKVYIGYKNGNSTNILVVSYDQHKDRDK